MSLFNIEFDIIKIKKKINHKNNTILISCLCSKWCEVCNKYYNIFNNVAKKYKNICFVWIDVDYYMDKYNIYNINIKKFPTLVIEDHVKTIFFGEIIPKEHILDIIISKKKSLNHVNKHIIRSQIFIL